MLLHEATWREVEAYLTRSTGVIIPTGSTEQHGPNGLIGTDSICPEAIGRAAGENVDALVGPTLALGVAPFNLGFPGTVSARPSSARSGRPRTSSSGAEWRCFTITLSCATTR